MTTKPEVRHSPVAALLYGAPIGLLGGLIGLGGAEFRLPVLASVFGYAARRAVALNLAISLITVVSALLIRGGTLSLAPLLGLLPVVLAMITGAVSAASDKWKTPKGEPSPLIGATAPGGRTPITGSPLPPIAPLGGTYDPNSYRGGTGRAAS